MRWLRGSLLASAGVAIAGLFVLNGCTQLFTHDTLAEAFANRPATPPTPPAEPGTVPRETDGREAAPPSEDALAVRNSKRYYVITEGPNKTEEVHAFPATGTETVLDAIAGVKGLPDVMSKKSIRLVRKQSDGSPDEVLPVDWIGITQHGLTNTNYQLISGDRLYVTGN